jgi:hypothetical protein
VIVEKDTPEMLSRWTWMIVPTWIAVAGPAASQARDPAAAEALFRQGREAIKRGDYATACPKFAESQRLDPGAGTLLNLAQCEEKAGRLASAWQHYQEAADVLAADDPRLALAKQGITALEKSVPRLTVRLAPGAPAGTSVLRDEVELGSASLGTPLPVDPGEHVIVTKSAGRQDHRQTVVLKSGESREVIATIGGGSADSGGRGQTAETASLPANATTSVSTTTTPTTDNPQNMQRMLGYAAGGLGVVGLGLGTYFSLSARSKNNNIVDAGCNDSTCPAGAFASQDELNSATQESQDAASRAKLAFIAGGVLLVGGVVLVLTSPSASGKPQVSLSATAGPNAAGMRIGGAW